jgi:hypothetical protein
LPNPRFFLFPRRLPLTEFLSGGTLSARVSNQTKEGRSMVYQTEAKPQGWRAMAVFDDRPDCLLYLGRSSTQVRAGLATAFFEVLEEDERDHVRSISLQRWHGAADAGRWMHQTNLTVPTKAKLAQTA